MYTHTINRYTHTHIALHTYTHTLMHIHILDFTESICFFHFNLLSIVTLKILSQKLHLIQYYLFSLRCVLAHSSGLEIIKWVISIFNVILLIFIQFETFSNSEFNNCEIFSRLCPWIYIVVSSANHKNLSLLLHWRMSLI